MGDWVISCLQEKAKFFEDTGCVVVYNADVVKSDKAVPEQLKQELREAVSTLENIPAIHRDWHPGSDEKVLDLVHPSLFPLMYGRSRALTDGLVTLDNCLEMCGKGDITAIPDKPKAPAPEYSWAHVEDPAKLWSNAFQWLPCEVKFNDGQAK